MIFNYHGIETAIGTNRNYIGEGQYELLCQSNQETENHLKEVVFEATFQVIQSSNPSQPPGSIVTFYQKMNKSSALNNLNKYLAGLGNKDQSEINHDFVAYILSREQPGANRRVYCIGSPKIIGKNNPQNPAGKEWTVYDWYPIPDQQPLVVPIGFSSQAQQQQFNQPAQFSPPMQPHQPAQFRPPMQPQQPQQPPMQPPMQPSMPPMQQPAQFSSPMQPPMQQPQQQVVPGGFTIPQGSPPSPMPQPQVLTGWKPQ
jgi:hypothetical protein